MTVTNEAWEEVGQGSLQRTRADARTVHAVREPLNLFWNTTPGADEALLGTRHKTEGQHE